MSSRHIGAGSGVSEVESTYAWLRLTASLLIGTVGSVGMWSVVVALPAVQAEFGVDRGDASLPYTVTLLSVAVGSMIMGRLVDRFGIVYPVVSGAIALCIGYVATSQATSIWQFAILHGVVIGFLGSSVMFAPLIADISHWFTRRRGIAVAICASGSYMAGTVWPPLVQHLIDTVGWRQTHIVIGLVCVATIIPLTLALRRSPPRQELSAAAIAASGSQSRLGISSNTLLMLLVVAGISCCVAMSMPQVHIVAYCGDLGYGAARGAEMLSLMLGFGVISRLISGWIADKIGGLGTVLLGSALQALALILYVPYDGLASLYVISALFGLSQGGIVPSYAIVVREYFAPGVAGARVGTVLMSTMLGMALGGWLSGVLYDWTGSYQAAFINGILWNLLNVAIIAWLLMRRRSMQPVAA
ncbi:MFS transporter [Leptospira interrogans]